MSERSKIGLILLAAGASKRLGQPKQLVSFKGKTLLQHAIDSCQELDLVSRVLILGSNAEKIEKEVNTHSFLVSINKDWEDGMSSSLRMGIKEHTDLDGVLILVADQPYISAELLSSMIELYRSGEDIVACRYEDTTGVPVLFDKSYFKEILRLTGDAGARRIIKKHLQKVKTIKFDQGNFDIDTPQDLKRLKEE